MYQVLNWLLRDSRIASICILRLKQQKKYWIWSYRTIEIFFNLFRVRKRKIINFLS